MNQYTETPLDFRVYDKNGNLTQVSNKTQQPDWHAVVPRHGVSTSGDYTLSGTIGESAYPKELETDDNKVIVGYQQSEVGIRTMEYDYKNQLVKFTDEAGNITEYMYDALGRRIAKVVNVGQSSEKTTEYFHNGWQVVEERDGDSGQPLAWYVYGSYIDEVLAMVVPGTDPRIADPTAYEWPIEDIFFYHQDDLYNVVALTDETGSVFERHEYLDYGQMIDPGVGDGAPWRLDDPAATGQQKTFTGREYDPETGYYYYRTRYMDADSGRFVSRDPAGPFIGDGPNNIYKFVKNKPTSFVDPTGMWGRDVHYGETSRLASAFGYKRVYGGALAQGNHDTDSGSTGPKSMSGQGRHLNSGPIGGYNDSRIYWYNKEKDDAAVMFENGKCMRGIEILGMALHSRQDISAHRGWPGGGRWVFHVRHPFWWDYYGKLPEPNIEKLQNTFYDGYWLIHYKENRIFGTDYLPWNNLPSQVSSQKKAKNRVAHETASVLNFDFKKILSCCKDKVLDW